jgi:putative transposase
MILSALTQLYAEVKGIYGYRRMTMNINRKLNKRYNLKRIYRLMKSINLKSVIRRKRKTYIPSTPQITVENILNRNFSAVRSNPYAQPLFHSDRGFQYTNKQFKNKLDRIGATPSMSRISRCIDNGPMQGFWGILKSEMFYLQKFHTFEDLNQAINEYINFYNTRRLQKNLKGLTPMEYRNQTLTG